MTNGKTKRAKIGTPSGDAKTYKVGYGKPPLEHRFRPRQSGNPRGRPRGSGNLAQPHLIHERLKSIILDEAYRTISVNDVKGPIAMPMVKAVIRSVGVNAVKGNQRAQRLFTQLVSVVERENKELHDQLLETAINYKVEWEVELERRKRERIQGPAPVPHPDDIVIDMRTGKVRFVGPMTKEEVPDLKISEERAVGGAPKQPMSAKSPIRK